METNQQQQQQPPPSDTKPCIFTSTTTTSTAYPTTTSLSSQPAPPLSSSASYLHLLQQQQQQLQLFWSQQRQEIEQVNDFKNHQLPLARIKKIMKADEDVRMISAEAPILFAKACELFILELTIRAWLHAEENKRKTLQKNDIAAAITRTDMFDFLVDIVPRPEEIKDEASGLVGGIMTGAGMVAPAPSVGGVSVASGGMPYYYPPVAPPPTAVMIGRSGMDPTLAAPAGMYAPPHSQNWQSVWQPAEDGGYGSEITGGESQQDDVN